MFFYFSIYQAQNMISILEITELFGTFRLFLMPAIYILAFICKCSFFLFWKTDCFCRLTSWAIRIFKHASFQDWENLFYIEPQIITRCTEWILQFQTELGSFEETAWYHNPLDAKMQGKVCCSDALHFNCCKICVCNIL